MRNVKSLAMYRWTQDNGGWAVGMLNNWHDFYRNRTFILVTSTYGETLYLLRAYPDESCTRHWATWRETT